MSRVAIAYEPGPRDSAVCYSLRTIMEFLGLEYHLFPYSDLSATPPEDLLVSYGRSVPETRAAKHIHIHRSGLLYEEYLEKGSLPGSPLQKHGGLPVIYTGGERREPFVKSGRAVLATNIDIPASLFFMISRYEETLLGERDGMGRFPASSSLACREGFLSYPIVDRYLDLFGRLVEELGIGMERRPRWMGRKFAVCLTHDIDSIRRYTPQRVARELIGDTFRGKPRAAARLALDSLAVARGVRQDPYWTFDFIMNLEERSGIRSSFFIRTDYDTGSEGGYSIQDAGPSQLVKYIASRGHEIGLHGGVRACRDPLRMLEERRRLSRLTGRSSPGARQHCLVWENPETWRAMAAAGILYDSSVAFPGSAGFRCGVSLPFKVFDVERGRPLPLWEVPLTVADACFPDSPGGEGGEGALPQVMDLISTVKKAGGVFVLNWKNSSLGSEPLRRAYAELVEHIAGEGAYAGTLSGALRCWTQG